MTSPAPAAPSWDASPFVPASRRLSVLADAAASCRGCPLYVEATQTVFGEGKSSAALVLVGEQPGDQEDRQGHPFVGPAGRMLWDCIERAGLDRADVYVTNAVKHFKHESRGKRRLHKKPTAAEADACHPWLAAELAVVENAVVVALGAVAARSLFGRTVGIADSRGAPREADGRTIFVTYHPSAVLRAQDDQRWVIRDEIVADLIAAAAAAKTAAR